MLREVHIYMYLYLSRSAFPFSYYGGELLFFSLFFSSFVGSDQRFFITSYFIYFYFIAMKAFMTSGSVISPFFYTFFLFSLPTAALCQISIPSPTLPSASIDVLNSGLPHHQSTLLPVDYRYTSV